MNLLQVLQHHLAGGEIEYLSLDYDAALEAFKATDEFQNHGEHYTDSNNRKLSMWSIPEEIRSKHTYWRSGKVRSVEFSPSGSIYRIYIGAKYKRAFYEANINELKLI